MTPRLKKALRLLFKLVLSVLFFWIIARKVDIPAVLDLLRHAHVGFLILACGIFFISKLIAAERLRTYYITQDLLVKWVLVVKIYLLSMFYNVFLPFLGGEGYKVYYFHRRYATPIASLIWSSLLDRLSGLVVLTVLALVFMQLVDIPFDYTLLGLPLIPIGIGLYYFLHKKWFASYHGAWTRALLLSCMVQALMLCTAYAILCALDVQDLQLEYLFIFLLASFAYVVPVIGARELAFVFGASAFGLNMELSLTIGLFFYLAMIATSAVGGFLSLFPKWYDASSPTSATMDHSIHTK